MFVQNALVQKNILGTWMFAHIYGSKYSELAQMKQSCEVSQKLPTASSCRTKSLDHLLLIEKMKS